MLRKQFEIPSDSITDFTEVLAETGLANEIKGANEDGEIVIEVTYTTSDRALVFDLVEWCDENLYEEEEDDE